MQFIEMKYCTIDPCGGPKLQITTCSIKNNFKLLMVGENYELLPEVVFYLQI